MIGTRWELAATQSESMHVGHFPGSAASLWFLDCCRLVDSCSLSTPYNVHMLVGSRCMVDHPTRHNKISKAAQPLDSPTGPLKLPRKLSDGVLPSSYLPYWYIAESICPAQGATRQARLVVGGDCVLGTHVFINQTAIKCSKRSREGERE